MNAKFITLVATVAASAAIAQVQLTVVPNLIDLSHVQDSALPSIAMVTIGVVPSNSATTSARFQYTGVTIANSAAPLPPNFLVVTPAGGTTPSAVFIALKCERCGNDGERCVFAVPQFFHRWPVPGCDDSSVGFVRAVANSTIRHIRTELRFFSGRCLPGRLGFDLRGSFRAPSHGHRI
jgi:hypothetical protein